MVREDSLKKRYLIKLLSNLIVGGLNVVIFAIVPKALGPVVFGQFVYLQEFFSKLINFLDLSTSSAFFTKLSADNKRRELIKFYSLFTVILCFIVVLIIYSIEFFGYKNAVFTNISTHYIYYGLCFGFLTWLMQVFIKISDAYALTVSVELLKIAHRILFFLVLLYLVYLTNFDLDSYFFYQIIALTSFIFFIAIIFNKKNIFNKSLLNIKFNFYRTITEFKRFCSPLVLYVVVGALTALFDIWLLQKNAGLEQVGYYGLAFGIVSISLLFSSAMTSIITREFSKSYADNNIKLMAILFKRYIPMLYAITVYFATFVVLQSDIILDLFAGNEYKDAYWVLVVMAFYPIHQVYGQLSSSVFYATEQTKLFTKISLIPMFLGVLVSFGFIYLLNLEALGLALKMIIIQFIAIIIQLYYNTKFLNLSIKYFLLHQFFVVCLFLLIAFISSYLTYNSNTILNFIISGSVYTTLVIVIAYFYPTIFSISKQERDKILTRFLPIKI
jgi:O-antigen/teichoic acid export membrane protein